MEALWGRIFTLQEVYLLFTRILLILLHRNEFDKVVSRYGHRQLIAS